MSKESQNIFKLQLQFEKQRTQKDIKVKKVPTWIMPTAYARQLNKILKLVMDKYINVTMSLFPLFEKWDKEVQQINDDIQNIKNDNDIDWVIQEQIIQLKEVSKRVVIDIWEEELEIINEEQYENLFNEEKSFIKKAILATGVLISNFNKKQWQKVTKKSLGVETLIHESWENVFLNAWTTRNVNLIKGLTEEYRKKIMDTVIDSYQKGVRVEELKANLRKINKTFSEARVQLIARDQTSKLNAQLARQRQIDAGVDTYIWITAGDERVRKPKHSVMNGKLCRWDNPTVYSPDNGKTWIGRGVGVMLHPGEDYQCRCYGEPNFTPLVKEVNSTQESILG